MVFHRILDFKTGLNVYSDPFFILTTPGNILPESKEGKCPRYTPNSINNGTSHRPGGSKNVTHKTTCYFFEHFTDREYFINWISLFLMVVIYGEKKKGYPCPIT